MRRQIRTRQSPGHGLDNLHHPPTPARKCLIRHGPYAGVSTRHATGVNVASTHAHGNQMGRWDRSRPTTMHPVQAGYTGDRQQAIREEPNHTFISSRKGWPGPFRKFGFVANFYIKRLPRILEPMELHGRRSASTRAPLRQRSMHAPEPAPGLGPDRKP